MSNSTGTNQQSVIEFTYGRNADLYEDVLKISSDAKPNDIKAAFFDRRAELYEEVSSKNKNEMTPSERQFCEKKMDAIVLAFRILHNRETRRRYDNMSRKNRQKLNYSETYSDRAFTRYHNESAQLNKSFPVHTTTTRNHQPVVVTPEKDFIHRKSLGTDFEIYDTNLDQDYHDDDDGTVSTLGMRGAEGISPVKKKPQSEENIVPPSPTHRHRSTTSSVRIEKARLKDHHSTLNTSRDDQSVLSTQSVHSTQSDTNNSVNSDVLISRQRLNAKSMSVWTEDSDDSDEEDEDTISYVSQDSSSQATQATSNTIGDVDDENDSDLVSFNTYEPTQEENQTSTPPRSQLRKRDAKHIPIDESNTDAGCFKLSKKELQDLDKDMVEGKSCFELMQGENGMPNPTRMFHLISDEISGSLIDTVNALDQVFTAFNLSEENIDRVGDNIGDVADTLCLDDQRE